MSNWASYLHLILSAALAVGVFFGFRLFARLLRYPGPAHHARVSRRPEVARTESDTSQSEITGSTRFFLPAKVFAVLILGALLALPITGLFNDPNLPSDRLMRMLLLLTSTGVSLGLGLIFAAKKGDLKWKTLDPEGHDRD